MKLFFDFLPILLFFGAFKFAEGRPDAAAAFATEHLGFAVSGGVVGPEEAPVLLATVVVIVATLAQVLFLLARGRKVDTMLWVSLAIIVVFGGATLALQDETFIKWKPTVLYWLFGLALVIADRVFGKNLIRTMMTSAQIELPEPVWAKLNLSWCLFFIVMGILNLYVAYSFSTDTWVNFKLFGGTGLMLVFVLGQAVVLSRFIEDKGPN